MKMNTSYNCGLKQKCKQRVHVDTGIECPNKNLPKSTIRECPRCSSLKVFPLFSSTCQTCLANNVDSWYVHENLNRAESEEILRSSHKGAFLIRRGNHPNILSYKGNDSELRHCRLFKDERKQVFNLECGSLNFQHQTIKGLVTNMVKNQDCDIFFHPAQFISEHSPSLCKSKTTTESIVATKHVRFDHLTGTRFRSVNSFYVAKVSKRNTIRSKGNKKKPFIMQQTISAITATYQEIMDSPIMTRKQKQTKDLLPIAASKEEQGIAITTPYYRSDALCL